MGGGFSASRSAEKEHAHNQAKALGKVIVVAQKEEPVGRKISVNDLLYYEPLGNGGFGRVVAARIQGDTSNRLYAIKIVPKICVLNSVQGVRDLKREKTICEGINCPFIVKVHFATQTEDHAILGMDLVDGIQLSRVLSGSGGLSETVVRFIVAELALALRHLHLNNIVYRDVKVDNVMLDEGGHVKLVDLGVARLMNTSLNDVVEEKKDAIGKDEVRPVAATAKVTADPSGGRKGESDRRAGPIGGIVRRFSTGNKAVLPAPPAGTQGGDKQVKIRNRDGGEKQTPTSHRRISIVGTSGYMAPEILRLTVRKARPTPLVDCFGAATDFWALGAFMFKLLAARRPFPAATAADVKRDMEEKRGRYSTDLDLMLSSEPDFPPNLSGNCCDVMRRLLFFDPEKRLGSDPAGFEGFKTHPFFEGLDWEALERREVQPPYVPPPKEPRMPQPMFANHRACVIGLAEKYDKKHTRGAALTGSWAFGKVDPEQQKQFEDWDTSLPVINSTNEGVV